MPAFRFEAVDADGATRQGLLEADSARAARTQLRAQQLIPLTVSAVDTGNAEGTGRRLRRAFDSVGLTVWTRQLAGLLGAGLPLERALSALADEGETAAQRELVAHLKSEVNGGASLAHALSQRPRDFDDVYRAVVAAGEQSGALAAVLARLADDLEERQSLKARLIGATLYPAIVSVIALVIVVFLVTYVVPQVAAVFTGSRRALPTLTLAMLAISAFLRNHGWILLLMLVGASGALVWAWRHPRWRERIDAMTLRMPLVGRLALGYSASRFAGTLALLAGAGVPILKALQAAAETLGNRALRQDAQQALAQVREGAPLAAALSSGKRFPGLLAMFARIGEQTGELPVMLERAARQLSQDVQRRAMALATLLEPLLIVVMGAFVLLIVLAVLLPIIQLNTWVR